MGIGLVYPMFSSILFHRESLILPSLTTDLLRGFWLGILLAAMPLGQFFSSPIMGSLSDLKGRKPVLMLTLVLSFAGYFLCTYGVHSNNLLLLLAGRTVVGIAAGNVAVAGAVIADLSRPEEKGGNFGLLNMVGGLGFTVGPFFGGLLSENSWISPAGFDKPFIFSAFLTVLNLFFLCLFFKETYPIRKKIKFTISFGFTNLKRAFDLKEVRSLLICTFVFCFGWSFYWEFIPVTWIEDFGMSASQVGNFYAYAAAIYALSCGLLIRPILKRWNPVRILFFSLICLGIYILFFPSNHPNWLWAYFPIQQYLTALLFPTAATFISDCVDSDIQGEAMGIYQSTEALAFGLSPMLSGAFVGLSHHMPVFIGGLSMLIAAFVLVIGCTKRIFPRQP